MEYFNFENKEEAQSFVDKVNNGENLKDTTTKYCDVEKIVKTISMDEVEIIGYKVIKDKVTEKYI
jgi:hypothetical protein